MRVVTAGSFARVRDNSHEEYGVKKGDLVYVAGEGIVSTSKDDPYALRRIFIVAKTSNGHILSKEKALTVDGKRLYLVPDKEQLELDAIKQEDFKEVEQPTLQ